MERTDSHHDIPSIFVVLGATGDLAAKKIIPALWYLFRQERLPKRLAVIGLAKQKLSQGELEKMIRGALVRIGDEHLLSGEEWKRFLKIFSYRAGKFEEEESFRGLAEDIDEVEKVWRVCANKLFYLAVPPSTYENIFKNLAKVKLNLPCGGDLGWSRVLVEKPFGVNLASANELQSLLSKYFREEQIYRIDHYLFKEIIQGIENFRFSNNLFEDTWDKTTIERIDIRLLESIGVEQRGAFYDTVGALRDVGQNHMLTMLAAITMEYLASKDTNTSRMSRAEILKKMVPWTEEAIKVNTFRAQYRGYKEISGVGHNSETETYFALKTGLFYPRWRGVPIFMEAGKRMGETRKEIIVTLKHPKVCLLCQAGQHKPNRIIFRLEPNDEIVIDFWAKKPGFEQELEERTFSFFLYEKENKVQYVEEYAKAIYAAMAGNQSSFLTLEEVTALWRFTDPVIDGWKKGIVPLVQYDPGTTPTPVLSRVELVHAHGNSEKGVGVSKIGMIGLGKMGGNMAKRLLMRGWDVVGYNATDQTTRSLEKHGLIGAYSLRELVDSLSGPRVIWIMVPYQAVDDVLDELVPLLDRGDLVIDGGNSFYRQSMDRARKLAAQGIGWLDVGVSGGPGGALTGACMMIGGKEEIYNKLDEAGLWQSMCVPEGWGYMGPSGAGHFVKMVHNGIEYGMVQSIAEGFDLLRHSKEFKLDLEQISRVYAHGSVIASSLISWANEAYAKYGADLNDISGRASASGEGKWTVETGEREEINMPAIKSALAVRASSQKRFSYQGKVISALRGQFGHHQVKRGDDEPEIL